MHRGQKRSVSLGRGMAGKGCIEQVTLGKPAEVVVEGIGNQIVYKLQSQQCAKCISKNFQKKVPK